MMTTKPAPATWSGSARMGLGWGLFVGCAGDGEPHAHHAVQIVLADSPQSLWTPKRGWTQHAGIVIGPDVEHQLAPTNEAVVLLYVEPHSAVGRRLQRILSDGLCALDSAKMQAARQALGQAADANAINELARTLAPDDAGQAGPLTGDPLIEQLIGSLPLVLPDRLPASTLATQAGLSKSRFLHRFRDHTGLPLRPYLRWRRLLTAITQVMTGHSLTDAAVSAGFSDAAHFTRTFRRHFGIAPRTLLGLQARA